MRVEALEERMLPSTVQWLGGNGNWTNAQNWYDASNNTHHVPGGNDNAVISSGVATVPANLEGQALTLSGAGSVIADGILYLNGSGSSLSSDIGGTLTVNTGGAVVEWPSATAPVTLTVEGLLTCNGGSLGGAIVTNGGMVIENGLKGADLEFPSSLTLQSNTDWVSGDIQAFDITNQSTFLAQASDSMADVGFDNLATFENDANNVWLAYASGTGEWDVQTGTLALEGGSIAGLMNLSAGAGLIVQGNVTMADGAQAAGLGDLLVTGDMTLATNLVAPNLAISGGTLDGTGNLTINGQFTCTDAILSGSGTIFSNGTMTIDSNSYDGVFSLDGRTLDNAGTCDWSAIYIYVQDTGVFNNLPGATLLVDGNCDFVEGSFSNAGSMSIDDGADLAFEGSFANSGTLDINGAGLAIEDNFVGSVPTEANLSGGTYTVAAGAQCIIAPDVALELSGTLTGSGAGSLLLESSGPYNVAAAGATLDFSGSLAEIDQPADLEGGTLTNSGALTMYTNLSGSGDLVNTGTLTLNNAELNGTGSLINSGTLYVVGALFMSSGNNYSQTQASAVTALFLTPGPGTGFIEVDAGTDYGGGTLYIAGGTIIAGTGSIYGNVLNAGTIEPGDPPGLLSVHGNYTQASTGTLDVNIASTSSFSQLSVTGTATLDGTVNVNVENGFTPAIGADFRILTAAAVTGQPATFNGLDYNTNAYFVPVVSTQRVDLVATSNSTAAPVVTPPANQAAGQGLASAFDMGSFTEAAGGTGSWNVDVNWGDGTPDTTFSASQQGALGQQTHSFASAGTELVTVTVTDGAGLSGSASFSVTIDAPPSAGLSGPSDGVLYQLRNFTFTASAADAAAGFTYQISWGDGSPVQTIAATPDNTTVTASHGYSQTGSFTVAVTAVDAFGGTSNMQKQTITIAVAEIQTDNDGQGSINGLAVSDINGTFGLVLAPTGSGNNVKVTRNGKSLGTFAAPNGNIAIFGDGGSDLVTITGVNGSFNAFALSGSTATLAATSVSPTVFTIELDGMSDLVMKGGNSGNSFSNTATTVASTLVGGALGNSFAFTGDSMGAATTVKGGSGGNTLDAPTLANDQSNTWTISGTNAGTLNGTCTFANVQNLVGGGNDDWFQFVGSGKVGGSIQGNGAYSAAGDTLDYSNYSGPTVRVTLASDKATSIGGTWSGITTFVGQTAPATPDTLTGPNADSTWMISGANGGTLDGLSFANFGNLTGGSGSNTFTVAVSGSLTGALRGGTGANTLVGPDVPSSFTLTTAASGDQLSTGSGTVLPSIVHVQNFVGGSQPNDFVLQKGAKLAGTIDGGSSGSNRLDYSAYTSGIYVNLLTGIATGTGGIANIQQVYGGSGNDILVGNGSGILLHAGSGNDLLIGGSGQATIQAGSDQDIVISGSTSYDANAGALTTIEKYWANTTVAESTRYSKLFGAGTPTGGYALNSSTVSHAAAGDTIVLGSAYDWLFWRMTGADADDVTGTPAYSTLLGLPSVPDIWTE